MRWVLFDVDGTLVDAGGAGARALLRALALVFGRSFSRNGVPFAGRTDRAIIGDLLLANQVPAGELEPSFSAVFRALPTAMREETTRCPSVPCPGVLELMAALVPREDLMLGLLTGNLQETAAIKLASAGLDPTWFRFGAYGDESADRNALPPLALARGQALVGAVADSVLVVGDTPADIICARVNGLRSLAVATGPYSAEALTKHGPDYLLEDLGDRERVLGILLGDR